MSTLLQYFVEESLQVIAEHLDLTQTQRQRAETAYQSLSNLLAKSSELENLRIYPQGSFSLGTETKPISEAYDFDIDLVCEVPPRTFTSPKLLKETIGRLLKASDRYKPMLDKEGRRCWTVEYEEFHLDILPAQQEDIGIQITHKTNDGRYEWRHSNPLAYQKWFVGQQALHQRCLSDASIKPVPNFRQKDTLQRTIQLLKRHRDVFFSKATKAEQQNAPISIIITTLVAQNYKGLGLLSNLLNSVDFLEASIKGNSQGLYKILNPTDPKENFADKWIERPELPTQFHRWLRALQSDLQMLINAQSITEIDNILKKMFGERITRSVSDQVCRNLKKKGIGLTSIGAIEPLSSYTQRIPAHNFYGTVHEY